MNDREWLSHLGANSVQTILGCVRKVAEQGSKQYSSTAFASVPALTFPK